MNHDAADFTCEDREMALIVLARTRLKHEVILASSSPAFKPSFIENMAADYGPDCLPTRISYIFEEGKWTYVPGVYMNDIGIVIFFFDDLCDAVEFKLKYG